MYSYVAYGMGIHSELLMPEFIQANANEDVVIRVDAGGDLAQYRTAKVDERKWDLSLDARTANFFIEDVGVFLIRNGSQVTIIPAPECSEQVIRLYLLGTVMSILLYQRGQLVLHGSTVEIEQQAVVFLGTSGAGKSTTTVALHASGHRILADDIAAIDPQQRPMSVAAGSPQIKVGPGAAKILGYDFDSLHELHPLEPKRGYRFKENFSLEALPIRRIYVLGFGDGFRATPLKTQDATIELIRHSRPTTLKFCGGKTHFLQCAELAKALPVYRLERPCSLDLLSEFSSFIEHHVRDDSFKLLTA